MNLEEERKAFEAAMVKVIADKAQAMYGDNVKRDSVEEQARKYIANLDEEESLFSVHFAMWCAAKAHAAEMAKPVARVSLSSVANWIVYGLCSHGGTFNGIIGKDFTNKAAAVTWAKASGYRVVEE
jgi:hypothetical protein